MPGIACAATAVVIGLVAGGTNDSRWFWRRDASQSRAASYRRAVRHPRTLYPKRIDLGLGRAPGTDQSRREPCGAI